MKTKELKLSKEGWDYSEEELLEIQRKVTHSLKVKQQEKVIKKQQLVKDFWSSVTNDHFEKVLSYVKHNGPHFDVDCWNEDDCDRCILVKAQQGCPPDDLIFKLELKFCEPDV